MHLEQRVHALFHLGGEAHAFGVQSHAQLLQAGGTDDIRGHEGAGGDEGEGEGRRIKPEFRRQRRIGADRLLASRLFVALAAFEERGARAERPGAAQVFAGEIPLAERGIGEQAHLFAHGDFGKADLEGPVQQIIGILDGDDARSLPCFGAGDELHRAPGRLIGKPDMADLAGLDEIIQRAERLLDRHLVRRIMQPIGIAAGAEQLRGAVGPVQLVEVDIIRPQPLQRGFERLGDMGAVQPGRAALRPQVGIAPPRHLGGEDHPIARAAEREPIADEALGGALRLALRGNGIDFRGIEEVDAMVERHVHLGMGFGLGVLLSPGHGAKADGGDAQIGAAKGSVFGQSGILTVYREKPDEKPKEKPGAVRAPGLKRATG